MPNSKKSGGGKRSTAAKKASAKSGSSAAMRAAAPKEIRPFPYRAVFSTVCLVMAVLNLFSCAGVNAILTNLVRNLESGLLGGAGYYLMCAVWLLLFFVLAFSHSGPVRLRSACCFVLALSASAISHLTTSSVVLPGGLEAVKVLYQQGQMGSSGGVLGGLIALAFRAAVGKTLALVLLCALLVLALLEVFRITPVSLYNAFQNRPRLAPEEDEEEPEPSDPASVVVNHLAYQHISRVERRRQAQNVLDEDPEAPLSGWKKARSSGKKPISPADYVAEQFKEPSETKPPKPRKDSPLSVFAEPEEMEEEQAAPPESFSGETMPNPQPIPEAEHMEPDSPEVPDLVPPLQPGAGEKVTARDAAQSAAQVAQEISQKAAEPVPEYHFPPVELLPKYGTATGDNTEEMRLTAKRLAEILQSFRIHASVCNVTHGPTVTLYEIELEQGVRLSKITTLANDIALYLGVASVRVAAVQDKQSVVGIEVPNKQVAMVSLREVVDSPTFARSKSRTTFALGKDISGESVVGDISRLPHLLIAGTTGSGKSVCVNSILISMIYKAKPDEVKFVMIDPKMVELGVYNDIPHLLIPVVTDPKKAAGSLQWAVTEMLRRYRAMADAGVREIESYNQIMEQEGAEKLPKIVVVIDELADLMLVAAKEVEESICRVAQMGRAAGIHLIVATQRPSADVITGLMKANIPSRIAFAVASAMESRIILDTTGAEKLLGRGDMLFAPLGQGKPRRVQGCFLEDKDVEAVTDYVKSKFNSEYSQDVLQDIESRASQTGKGGSAAPAADAAPPEEEGDELLPNAVEVILETGQASVSMLQRRLKLGYARAARIVDEMEEKGIVGPYAGAKPRAILITREQWQQMQSGQMTIQELEEIEPVPEEIP